MTDVDYINKVLALSGKNDFGQPLYRVVWSDYQLEKRKGVFRDFLGKVFLREYVGVREVPKYNYLKERWILERWLPPSIAWSPELPDSSQGSYEPIYVFQDKFGNFLQANLKVAQLIVDRAETPTHVTPEERMAEKDEIDEKEVQFYMDYLDTSVIQNALHMKDGVGYGQGIKDWEPEKEEKKQ